MAKNTRWSADDLKKKGLVQNEAGDYVPVSSLVNKGKVEKLPSLIERASAAQASIDESNRKIRKAISDELSNKGLNTKIDRGPGAYDGGAISHLELDEYGLMENPRHGTKQLFEVFKETGIFVVGPRNPFTLPDGEVIGIKFEFDLDPFPAPRMTRSDKWRTDPYHPDPKKRQRQCVFRYFAWRAAFTAMASQKGYVQGERLHVVFIFPLPVSYSRKKRETLMGQWHKQRPDYDNCAKSIGDAFRVDDGYICDVRVIKLWGPVGRILIF